MSKHIKILLAAALVSLGVKTSHADSPAANAGAVQPWEKFSFTVGGFFSHSDSGVRLGDAVGVEIDLEDSLGFDQDMNVFRTEASWRFTNNRKHRVDFSWFGIRRDAQTTIGHDLILEGDNGNTITIPTGSNVTSKLNIDLYETAYSYSFIQDQRVDLAGIAGLYMMPIDFQVKSTGAIDTDRKLSLTAPLPVIGLRVDVAMTPKWFLRTSSQMFAWESEGFSGRLTQLRGAIEYLPMEHVGVGLGLDNFNMSMDGKGAHFPGINFRGKVDYQYNGVQLYGKVFF